MVEGKGTTERTKDRNMGLLVLCFDSTYYGKEFPAPCERYWPATRQFYLNLTFEAGFVHTDFMDPTILKNESLVEASFSVDMLSYNPAIII